jgi:hypothetical protein
VKGAQARPVRNSPGTSAAARRNSPKLLDHLPQVAVEVSAV